jgi:hypothetical protein
MMHRVECLAAQGFLKNLTGVVSGFDESWGVP